MRVRVPLLLAGLAAACASPSGDPCVGYKLALTSETARARFGAPSPVWAPLRRSMQVPEGGSVGADTFARVLVEGEIAFTIARRLDVPIEDPAALRAYVGSVHAAVELADWRFAPGARPGLDEIAADGAGAHRFALGPGRDPHGIDLAGAAVAVERDGQPIGRGRGADALGDPWRALAWLAQELVERGRALEPGDVVLTGAAGPVHSLAPAVAAGRYRVEVEGVGSAAVSVSPRSSGSGRLRTPDDPEPPRGTCGP